MNRLIGCLLAHFLARLENKYWKTLLTIYQFKLTWR